MDSSLKYKALVDIAKILNADIQRSEEDICELICQQTIEKLGINNLSIALYDRETDTVCLVLTYSDGRRVDIGKEQGWKICNETVIRSKKPLYLPTQEDIKKAGYYSEKIADSWLGVPMIVNEQVIGVIATYHYGQSHFYTENDIEILQTFSDLAAIAIENSHLHLIVFEDERRLLHTLMDNMPDHIYFKDSQSRFILANKTVLSSMGVKSLDDIKGKKDSDFHSPELARQYYEDERKLFEKDEPLINKEEQIRDSETGKTIWLSTTKIPFRDASGNIVGLVGINRDITENKRAKEALQKAHEELEIRVKERTKELSKERNLLRTLINNMPDYIYVKDTQSRFLIANPAVANVMRAKSTDELIGKTDFDYYDNNEAARYYEDEQSVIKTQLPVKNRKEESDSIKGNRRVTLTTKVPFHDEYWNVAGIIGIGRDITELQLSTERLEKLNHQQNTLIELAQKLTSSIQLKEKDIFQLIHNYANQIMDTDNMYIALW